MKTKPIQAHSRQEYRSPEAKMFNLRTPSLLNESLSGSKPESYIIDEEEIW